MTHGTLRLLDKTTATTEFSFTFVDVGKCGKGELFTCTFKEDPRT